MKRHLPTLVVTAVALLALTAVACGGDDPNLPPPPPPPATDSAALPTPTLQNGAPVATDAPATLPPPPVSAAATATAPPTVGPAAPTAVPTSGATPAPAGDDARLLVRGDFAPDRNIFTGERVDDPARLDRRPVACKLSNFPAQWTRPQSGLNDADLLFEHLTEGGLTRFTAIFYGRTPPTIGPIRSARLIDMELPAMYDAALCFSGASTGVSSKLNSSDFATRLLRANEPAYYRTGANKPLEHTFYARPDAFWTSLAARGLNTAPAPTSQMAFSAAPPPGAPASRITINYNSEIVTWRYDAANGRYWRWSDNVVHVDANTGEQLNFRNVVVVVANHVNDANICEEIRDGRCVALSVEIQLWGQGRALIFRDGVMVEATWRRANRNDMLTFVDGAGQPVPLQIGNTMFQVTSLQLEGQIDVAP